VQKTESQKSPLTATSTMNVEMRNVDLHFSYLYEVAHFHGRSSTAIDLGISMIKIYEIP